MAGPIHQSKTGQSETAVTEKARASGATRRHPTALFIRTFSHLLPCVCAHGSP